MSDIPKGRPMTFYRTAEVIQAALTAEDEYFADAIGLCNAVAAALAAAGLLADPTTSRTEAEQAVIDAARGVVKEWIARGDGRCSTDEMLALIQTVAAVDRLAAPGPKEATP